LSGDYDLLRHIAQILLIALPILYIYWRIRGTQVQRVFLGLLLLVPPVVTAYALRLEILIRLFELLIPALGAGLIVLFAPELRSFLYRFGSASTRWLEELPWVRDEKDSGAYLRSVEVLPEVSRAVDYCARNKIGALIVFDPAWSDRLYIDFGRRLDALVSAELLLNIFYPKSPLHDGAVVIRNGKIHAASVILPITENPALNPWQYGTRHRAALGATEADPSIVCVVVSEETGGISFASRGKLQKVRSAEELEAAIRSRLENR
jgi:diadenylate cyclase